MNKSWINGHIDPWWGNLHHELDYYNDNTVDVEKWRGTGFTHDRFTGDMYDMRNPEPSWMNPKKLQEEFQFEHLSWSFYRMSPGIILPEHVDTFTKFKELHNTENKIIVRALIMLEDWQQGHYLDMDRAPCVNWKAGDYHIWEEKCPHTAANIGTTNRYTLQLTGLVADPL